MINILKQELNERITGMNFFFVFFIPSSPSVRVIRAKIIPKGRKNRVREAKVRINRCSS